MIASSRLPAVLGALLLVLLLPFAARSANTTAFSIPAQALAQALLEAGRQGGVQVAFLPQVVAGRQAPALHGSFTIEAALRRLLTGSELEARSVRGSWIVTPRPTVARRAMQEPADQSAAAEEIVVTGSRILRRDYEAASPLITLDADRLKQGTAVSVEAVLDRLPQFQPAGTAFAAQSVVANAFSSPGIASLDLRGLGSNRMLVLIDGRRAQPANATLTVDVNSIPLAALTGVEVISGGTSAVYGADALAGVVNFKLRRDFQGLALDLQSGITQQGDGAETRFTALAGANLADARGNVLLGGEWSQRSAVRERDRRFFTQGWADPATIGGGELFQVSSYVPASANLPSQAGVNAAFPTVADVSRTTPFFVNPDGSLFKNTLVVGDPAASSVGYDGPVDGIKRTAQGLLAQPQTTQNLSSPLERYSMFGRALFALNDRVDFIAQGTMSSTQVRTAITVAPATSVSFNSTVPRDAAHPVPAALQALLDSRADPTASFQVDRYLDFLGPRHAENQSTVYQLLVGLEGRLPVRDWTWEAYGSHGDTRLLNYLDEGWASRARLQALIASPSYGRGQANCTTGLPIFDYFTPSQDCIDAISVRMKNATTLTQDVFETNVQGGVLTLPAGELRGALGASYRRNEVAFDPDVIDDTESVIDTPVGLFAAANTAGETRVAEVYGELLVPMLQDLPLMRRLNLELGARFSDYNTAGGSWTWKSLATWEVSDVVSMRGGYQLANRAPNVAELYLGTTQAVVAQPDRDPCTITTGAAYGNVPGNPNRAQVQALCSAIIGSGTSLFDLDPDNYGGLNGPNFGFEREARTGNTALRPEKADTFTAGLVLHAPFDGDAWRGFAATIDYYRIVVRDAIGPLAATTIYRGCFNADGVSNPGYLRDDPGGYCRLIERDPVTGGRLQVSAPLENLGLLTTAGVDVQVDWKAALADLGMALPGRVSANLSFNYLLDFTTQAQPGAPRLQNRGTLSEVVFGGSQTGQYAYRSLSSLGYSSGGFGITTDWVHLPSIRHPSYVTNPLTTVQGAGRYDLVGLHGTWKVRNGLALRMSIENLFDRQPEVVGRDPGIDASLGVTAPGFYDLLGRRFALGIELLL